jgi:hypothetical protein
MKKTKPEVKKLSLTPPKPAGLMRRTQTALQEPPTVADEASLLADLRALIQSARQRVATVANATQTLLYWHVGRRLLKENLQDGRAAYGKLILATVSQELRAEFGEGFTLRSLYFSIQFFELFPDETIVSMLSAQLRWNYFHINPTSTVQYVEAYRELWDSDREAKP